MSGRIAWMVRGSEQRRETGRRLERTDHPVRVLGVPGGNEGIELGCGHQGVRAGGAWGVVSEPLLEEPFGGRRVPSGRDALVSLGEESLRLLSEVGLEVDDLVQLVSALLAA